MKFLDHMYDKDSWDRDILRLESNKEYNRKWAVDNGIKVPRILYQGFFKEIPFGFMPYKYVIKPIFNNSCNGIAVVENGIDILTNTPVKRLSYGEEKLLNN